MHDRTGHPASEPDPAQRRGRQAPQRTGLYDPAFEHDSCGIGFLAHLRGAASHEIVSDALLMLARMDHRGGRGSEAGSGDGAGILTAMPDDFLRQVATDDLHCELPRRGFYAVGNVFLPHDPEVRRLCVDTVDQLVARRGQRLLGWRQVPVRVEDAGLGRSAREAMPVIAQLFVAASAELEHRGDEEAEAIFQRQLYLVRKQATKRLRLDAEAPASGSFSICSLSTRTLVYKGMLTARQVRTFYPDLRDRRYASHLAMVHSRFSTNTFPSWDRAQPNRLLSHNGEINTLRGNQNWMAARQGSLASPLFGDDLSLAFPIVEPACSDSGNFDNALELLVLAGRSLPEAVMMLIPEAWQNHETMSRERRAFYEVHSAVMEPWDGPASIAFTDGRQIGAVLDRNGLRPSRWIRTRDDRVVMASEVGVVDVDPADVVQKGRLQPGRLFLVDCTRGRIVDDQELKESLARRHDYAAWLDQRIELSELGATSGPARRPELEPKALRARQKAAGYTEETLRFMLAPLVREQRDPLGSMGNDAALACLSDHPHLVYDYFKQLFAQVTNPPIDSIREELILSLECLVGPQGNLLEHRPEQCRRLRLESPILDHCELAALAALDGDPGVAHGWRCATLDATWPRSEGTDGLVAALERLGDEAEAAVRAGSELLLLSDRAAGNERVAVPALLAVGATHHRLVATALRTRTGILVETGEAREVHHHCLLIGFGADAIHPYLAFETLWHAQQEGRLGADWSHQEIVDRYRKGVAKGLLKVMGKMGISTLASYKGAQIFEALGLHREVMDRCFVGTASRLQGAGFATLAEECLRLHELGHPARPPVRDDVVDEQLPNPGEFHWRAGGERHMWSPGVLGALQSAARSGDEDAYWRFAELSNEDATRRCTLRGLLELVERPQRGVRLDEVEPASEIVKRFCTGAMSFGSISAESHEALAVAMNRLGGKSNTGEGGEDPARFSILPNGDSRRSAIKQIASGRFGVTAWYLTNADELQIKMAQGAKPGEGGELPGHKVDEVIARTRHSTPGVGLISPPPHHDIYSIEDLAQLIHDLKNANPEARISVKLVSEVGVGTVAAGVVKAKAEHILISGHDGGTGASPLTSIKHAGLPWELGLAETHQTLVLNDLRSRVVLQTDGQLKTGRDVVVAALLGAEEFGFSTAPLIALGCIMMRKCHLNTCPVGIATQDPALRAKFHGKPEHVVTYLFLVAEEARRLMAKLGVRRMRDLVGRTDLLRTRRVDDHWKRRGLDLSAILAPARKPHPNTEVAYGRRQRHGLDKALDRELIALAGPVLRADAGGDGVTVRAELPVRNTNRTVGTLLSHEVMKAHGERGLPEDTIHLRFTGSAGQSFGAFLAPGITLELEGDANDYVGKGLSGGHLVLYPPHTSRFAAEENVIAGNVCLYGATSGRALIRGVVAERFAVRNSGAEAVVEGVGDHGCEYMTGGRVVVLGATGRNFAAGMSGGIAWVFDPGGELPQRCNRGMVDLEEVDEERVPELRALIEQHSAATGSPLAAGLLADWEAALPHFVQVMPRDYRRVLGASEGPGAEAAA
ncbi:MAG: glutamate synthase large subunit [Acidobacteria bacterium]|nr:MAG: glutamate synthase large subunit [Acidobacteriota bacterium]REK05405.1 MAG: glutamate synthase large subunit [Acidobacteriota bacterium]